MKFGKKFVIIFSYQEGNFVLYTAPLLLSASVSFAVIFFVLLVLALNDAA